MNDTDWVKARASGGNGGACVELRSHGGQVEVRDTKNHGTGPILHFSPAEFAAFLYGSKNGEFDHLLD